jgi:preprotein translocase subunit SecB
MKKSISVLQADEPPLQIGSAALQLDGYYVKELHCAVRADSDQTAKFALGTGLHVQQPGIMTCPEVTTKLTVEIGQNKRAESKFRVLLQIESDEIDEIPYSFDIQLVGFFSVVGVKPFIGMDVFVSRNAVMLLYSTAREVIASATGRGPFPALILPTLTFDITEKVRATIKEKAEAEVKKLAGRNPRQLLTSTKKASKKKASKKTSKK